MAGSPVLYSFRRCPYAMRARLALAVSGTQCELREVKLSNKPQEMLLASPKGTVPVLVLDDGMVIDESLDVMRWALARNDPDVSGIRLYVNSRNERAQRTYESLGMDMTDYRVMEAMFNEDKSC